MEDVLDGRGGGGGCVYNEERPVEMHVQVKENDENVVEECGLSKQVCALLKENGKVCTPVTKMPSSEEARVMLGQESGDDGRGVRGDEKDNEAALNGVHRSWSDLARDCAPEESPCHNDRNGRPKRKKAFVSKLRLKPKAAKSLISAKTTTTTTDANSDDTNPLWKSHEGTANGCDRALDAHVNGTREEDIPKNASVPDDTLDNASSKPQAEAEATAIHAKKDSTKPEPMQAANVKPMLEAAFAEYVAEIDRATAVRDMSSVYARHIEIPLGSVDPQALLTRSMRMFWDEDNAWYGGAFESYDADSGKHTVRYDDGAAEEVVVGDERFRTKMLPGESLMNEREENGIATAATTITTTTTAMEGGEIPADVDASPADTGPRIMCKTSTTTDVRPGEPVLAKMKGFPLWPARVLARADAAEIMPVLKMKEKQIPVLFFGTAEVASMDASQLLRIDNECRRVKAGKMMWTKAEMKKKRLPEAIKQLLHYLKTGTIPDIMSCLNILEEVDAAPEAIVTSAFDEVETAIAGMKLSDATFPLRIPGRWPVTIISLGAIQYIRPEFHTARHIYPVGYEVERITKSSLSQWADAPHILSVLEGDEGPVFCVSVSSSGDDSVHDVVVAREMSPVKLWHDVFYDGQQKIRKSGLLYLLNIYGLTSRPIVNLIQQLPNADRCERYGNWLHEKPPVPPPNEEMIEVAAAAAAAKLQLPPGVEGIPMTWPPNTCAVCDIAEEYDDNLLVQCDKCRMTVHQLCYGIKKFPDGVWLCNVCKLGLDKPPPCIACPMIGGPLKPTTDGRFIHLSCMTWIPETKAMNTETMEPISVGNIPKERYKLRCQICRVHYGACVQCVGACYASFHPMCARNHPDYGLEVLDSKDGAKLAAAFKDAARKSKSRKKKAAAVTSAAQTVTTTAASPDREGGEGSPLQEDGGGMDLNGGTFCLHAYCPKHKPLKNDIFSTTGRLSLLPPQPPVCHEVPSSSPPPPPPPPTLATAATTCTPGDTEKAVTTPGAYAPGVCSRMRVVGNSRKRLEPEEMAAAIKKRLVVKSLPYVVTGRRIEDPLSRHISTVMSPEVFARRVAERNARVYVGGGSSDDNGGDESKADGAQRLSVLRSTPTLGVGSREGLLSMSERFTRMHETLGERLTNGKSCIHGWGVFTKVPHLAGDMMIEYCGDLVRLEVAENRENRLYDKLVGAGTYVFRLDRLQCVDATRAGNMAHLINHSCEPNCFSRTITVHGTNHVVIFALRDIGVGEELSYDYRFSNDRETLACNCGAPKCRGIVNRESPHVDIPMDGAAIRVPTSQLVPIPR